jgi:F-type H+-transporting ATPase subunit b
MEFNVSTFVLESINFLVLLWVLQRLFYKPLLKVIAERKQVIEQTLAEAKNQQQQAEEKLALYENRQQQWEQEKQRALQAFQQQIDVERRVQLEKLQIELEQERQKARVTLSLQQQEFQQRVEQQALENGAKFSALLLQQAVGPELELRLFQLLLNKITAFPEIIKQQLTVTEEIDILPQIKVTSAYPITTEMHQALEQKLMQLMDRRVDIQYHQSEDLIAGVRLEIGAWVLDANLKHELIGFAELDYVSK